MRCTRTARLAPETMATTADRGTLLRASRRVDWRFLLPEPALGKVVCAGACDGGLLQSLELLARSVSLLERRGDREQDGATESFDVAVLCAPTRDELERAVSLLRPGGSVYLEAGNVVRDRRLSRLAGGYARTFEQLGLEDTELFWHVPSFSRAWAIVPLSEPGAVRSFLRRRRGRMHARLGARLGRLLAGTPLLALGAPHVSLVARRPDGTHPGPCAAVVPGSELQDLSFVLLTPGFRTSRHAVSLLIPRGSSEPTLVAKRPRLADDIEGIAREASVIGAVEGSSGTDGTIPRVVVFEPGAPQPVLVETALAGQTITPAMLRGSPSTYVEATVSWLAQLPTAPSGSDPSWYERLVKRPLELFAEPFPAEAEESRLAERTLSLVEPIRNASFPLVLEHGDLSHPNLVRLRDGRVGVLDWELGEERGLPLHDLCLFLAYVAFATRRARETTELLAAFDEAFIGPGAWAAPTLRAYADRLGLQADVLVPLFVCCWARYTSRLMVRAEGEPGREEQGADTEMWLRGNRYYALWKRAVEQAEASREPARTGSQGDMPATNEEMLTECSPSR
jgi:aminoglycoside phosphotransferase (APT) family kinase protein